MLEFTKSTQSPLLDENGKQAKWNIYDKVYIEKDEEKNMLPEDVIYDYPNSQGTKELNDLDIPFSFSKPSDLILYLLRFVNGDKEMNVLDFFSGSGTTAHAVMKLNSEDGGKRKFVMIQLPEVTKEDSEERKKGFETIAELGIERIKRAGYGLFQKLVERKNEAGLVQEGIVNPDDFDYGFRCLTIEPLQQSKLSKLESFAPVDLFDEKGVLGEFGVSTVLTTWMNLDGYGLSKQWIELRLADYVAYQIETTIYFLETNLSNDAIRALLEKYESDNFIVNKIVIFGYSFTMSEIQSIKDNLKQIEGIRHITLDIMVRY